MTEKNVCNGTALIVTESLLSDSTSTSYILQCLKL